MVERILRCASGKKENSFLYGAAGGTVQVVWEVVRA
jgi:hypothetical protein